MPAGVLLMTSVPNGANAAIEIAEDQHWWFHTRTQALRTVLDPLVRRGGLVLDVGCGAGNMAHHLSHYGQVVGADNAFAPLAIAWERGYVSLPAEGNALPFADRTFDLVALLDTIEHAPDDSGILAEAFRVSRPGGMVAITTPAFGWLYSHNDEVNHHLRRYTAGQLGRLLEKAGFEVRYLSYTYFLVFPAAAGLIMVRKLIGAKQDLASPDEGAYQVEMEPTPEPLNSVLAKLGDWEAALLRRTSLPWGTALLAVAERPNDVGSK